MSGDSIVQPYRKPISNKSTLVYKKDDITFENIEEEEEKDDIKKIPGIESIMEKLGKSMCDTDEISLQQLTAQFTIWMKANMTTPHFFESEFKTTFMDLISSIHTAVDGGPHLVCHNVSESLKSELSHECQPNKEVEERNAELV